MLRRRLLRLLKERDQPSRLLNLRHTARRIEYWFTAVGALNRACSFTGWRANISPARIAI